MEIKETTLAPADNRGYSRRRALVTFGGSLGVVGAAILAGCGSGGGTGTSSLVGATNTTGATGRATLTIVWPTATTRLIPVAANSITLKISNGDTTVGSQTVARPSSGTSTTVTFETLPVGTLTVQASAYPSTDGTGTAQASGASSLIITAGAVSPLTLTMGSTIDSVSLVAYSNPITVGTVTSIQLSAKDSSGATVLITTGTVSFTSLNSDIATVDATGSVTGVAVGTAQFRVVETESGKSATISVTVNAAPTPTPTPTPSTSPSAGSCTMVPQETDGPYPLYSALTNSSIRRSDVTAGQTGVPLTLNLTFVNVNGNCAPLTNAAIYIWHCNKGGEYSGYSSNQNGSHSGETFLRGVQTTDSIGNVTFTTIYPGWYAGRITHIHFEVFLNNTLGTSGGSAKATSQLAFPQAITQAVYASTLYAAHGQNTSVTNFSQDNVFSDGTAYQMLTVTGSVAAGYVASLVIGVKA